VAPPAQTQAAPATDPPQPPFGEWLAALKAEAIARGISVKTVDAVLTDVEPLAVVVARDRTQAELTLTFDRYLKRRLTKTFVETGRKMVRQNAALLRQVAAKYGVSPGTVVAIWGMESNYGRFSGT
jgi:membrane-bound lytic murein transglycosylase B